MVLPLFHVGMATKSPGRPLLWLLLCPVARCKRSDFFVEKTWAIASRSGRAWLSWWKTSCPKCRCPSEKWITWYFFFFLQVLTHGFDHLKIKSAHSSEKNLKWSADQRSIAGCQRPWATQFLWQESHWNMEQILNNSVPNFLPSCLKNRWFSEKRHQVTRLFRNTTGVGFGHQVAKDLFGVPASFFVIGTQQMAPRAQNGLFFDKGYLGGCRGSTAGLFLVGSTFRRKYPYSLAGWLVVVELSKCETEQFNMALIRLINTDLIELKQDGWWMVIVWYTVLV